MKTNRIVNGDCLDVLPGLDNKSIAACITSPPYAQQRKNQYAGIDENEYPDWTRSWMSRLKPKLKKGASVLIVIRAHVSKGALSDYVLRTRLVVRDDGWTEPDELIWIKPDAPPLGSTKYPRRCFEHVLWFSNSRSPYVNTGASMNGRTAKLGFRGSCKFGFGGSSPIHAGQQKQRSKGTPRTTDFIVANICDIKRNIKHPAMFPEALSDHLVQLFSRPNDIVLDPFCGSGTTCCSATRFHRRFIGIEKSLKYVKIARQRFRDTNPEIIL